MTALTHEHRFAAEGYAVVAGLDEAGRGALAGPVAAGAAVLPLDGVEQLSEVRDSKTLSAAKRAALHDLIQGVAVTCAVGMASAAEIDEFGIAPATRLAMQRAIEALDPQPQALIIDWVRLPVVNLPQVALKKGERHSLSVAAASILAKVTRDRWMIKAAADYPQYGFDGHKGYGTAAHRAAIAECGGCAIHRHTFEPLRSRLLGDE